MMQRAQFNLNEGLVDAQVSAGGCFYNWGSLRKSWFYRSHDVAM